MRNRLTIVSVILLAVQLGLQDAPSQISILETGASGTEQCGLPQKVQIVNHSQWSMVVPSCLSTWNLIFRQSDGTSVDFVERFGHVHFAPIDSENCVEIFPGETQTIDLCDSFRVERTKGVVKIHHLLGYWELTPGDYELSVSFQCLPDVGVQGRRVSVERLFAKSRGKTPKVKEEPVKIRVGTSGGIEKIK